MRDGSSWATHGNLGFLGAGDEDITLWSFIHNAGGISVGATMHRIDKHY